MNGSLFLICLMLSCNVMFPVQPTTLSSVLSSFCVGDSIRYGLVDKDSLVCSIEGQGFHSSKNKFWLKGNCKVKVEGIGKVILPDNESLSNTFLVKKGVVGDIFPLEMMPNEDELRLKVDAYER